MLILFSVVVGLSLWLLYRKTQIARWCAPASTTVRSSARRVSTLIDCSFSSPRSHRSGRHCGGRGRSLSHALPGRGMGILVYALVVVIFGGLGSLEGA